MKYRLLYWGALLVVTSACQTPDPMPDATYVEVPAAPAPAEPEPRIVAVPYPQPVPGQAKPWPEAKPEQASIEDAKVSKKSNAEILDDANASARQRPDPEGFVNAILEYDYMTGALYQVWGAPNHLTTISFKPGEELLSFGAGDTLRWKVSKTFSVTPEGKQEHLVVQPRRRDLHTTMVVTTTLGLYHFELRSYQHTWLAGVQFNYPYEQLEFFERERAHKIARREQADASHGSALKGGAEVSVDLTSIEDRYHLIVSNKRRPPAWTPKRVFHDGRRTFIDFGRELGQDELPALFALGSDKSARLVQYTPQGRYMVVGQVLEFAMLRLGENPGRDDTVGIELDKEARR